MSSLSTLILVKLDGVVPPKLNLPPLRTLSASCSSVSATLAPYLQEKNTVIEINSQEDFAAILPLLGLVAVYVVGHAWTGEQQYRASIRTREGSEVVSGRELAALLLAPFSNSTELILLI